VGKPVVRELAVDERYSCGAASTTIYFGENNSIGSNRPFRKRREHTTYFGLIGVRKIIWGDSEKGRDYPYLPPGDRSI